MIENFHLENLHLWLIPLLPFAGFLVNGILGRRLPKWFVTTVALAAVAELAQSYMIGDKLIDLQCGWNAGVRRCLLVRTGYGAELERASADKLGAAAVVDDLPAAAQWILEPT